MIGVITRLRRRRPRARLAWLVLCAIVLQQLALVAYACPIEVEAPSEPSLMVMPGCEDMTAPDPDYPALCYQHCEGDHVAVPDLKSPQVPPLVAPLSSFALLEYLLPPAQAQHYRNVPVCVSDPPSAQRFCSLQI